MLIVNADDLGASASATDAIIAAYDEQLITSASAMVWMSDSQRSAERVHEMRMPVGLHLNLTMPFRDTAAPAHVRALQDRLTESFDRHSWLTAEPAPLEPEHRIVEALRHQLEEFRRVFGEPTHIDGHHHVHLHPAVLASLPSELPVRPSLRRPAHLLHPPVARDRLLRMMFRAADGCVDFQHVHPDLGGAGLTWLEYGRDHVLEVMVHPQRERELAALRTDRWSQTLQSFQLGSYGDLSGQPWGHQELSGTSSVPQST